MNSKSYKELMQLKTFEEKLDYLKLSSKVGEMTFGGSRYINQNFYSSKEWRNFRNDIIVRDNGCELGCPDRPFVKDDRITIHHINPIDINDVKEVTTALLDPDNCVAVRHSTHMYIHYGAEIDKPVEPVERTKGDTCPWRR